MTAAASNAFQFLNTPAEAIMWLIAFALLAAALWIVMSIFDKIGKVGGTLVLVGIGVAVYFAATGAFEISTLPFF